MSRQNQNILLALVIAGGLVLLAAIPFLRAQAPARVIPATQNGYEVVNEAMSVASRFTYQGLLEENGSPVTGTRNMTFHLHKDADCIFPVGTPLTIPGVPVDEGLFSVDVSVDPALIDGQARWLEVKVNGFTVGCQELLPVPYALSLRPGAVISGSVGIRVEASGTGNAGLIGIGNGAGVRGETDEFDAFGGYFSNRTSNATGPDIVLGSSSNDEGNLWSDPDEPSSDIYLRSGDEVWVQLDENDDEDAEFRVRNGVNTTVFRVNESGDTFASGTKWAVVEAEPGEFRRVYAMESPEVVFEDFGSTRLENGTTTVVIEPLFAEIVNLETEYHVFLTPTDGWAALYVTNKTPASFEVHDANGPSSIAFDYRIVAKRIGYEDVRLRPVASPFPAEGGETDE